MFEDEESPGLGDLLGGDDRHILSTGNPEIDKKLADGLPLESLTLIEGENDTGKSVMTQQIIWGAMKGSMNVDLYTSENTAKSFLSQMDSMSLDISDYFAWGYLKIYPMHTIGFEWGEEEMNGILKRIIGKIQTSKSEVIIIDSLTLLTESTSQSDLLAFLTNCKNLVDHGKTILITLHTYAFEEDTLVRIRSICDAHLFMKKALIGDKYVMVMEVIKVRGARKTTGNVVSFEVHPGYGMKIIPMSTARV
ncbi:flagellar accessory protein FlaH [Methanoplanus sp. FWC-SCC4]|uniref:Flagellar accessory protein FlaH n=1 Tax=Methanochimaera problematica TaxID=2609417 RepID=A0AA97FA16_9EURY|nr:ATPase domain-containing protein [Methanoplanus sp. FWC-SCC4]WOF15620.1 flagellar accessory protein FlaH [Methanoplanus sp. FWC-SCC4]